MSEESLICFAEGLLQHSRCRLMVVNDADIIILLYILLLPGTRTTYTTSNSLVSISNLQKLVIMNIHLFRVMSAHSAMYYC